MNLGTARTELQARGYSRYTTGRLNTWLNDAKDAFEDYQYDWPWLKTTTSGTAPLTINDLRRVLSVTDATNKSPLNHVSADYISDLEYADLTQTGTPAHWYLTSDTALAVYPASTSVSVLVRYLKFSAALSGDSDTPLIPSRYHSTWVDLAEARVLRYGVKDGASADVVEQGVNTRLAQIAATYAMQDTPARDTQLISLASDDW